MARQNSRLVPSAESSSTHKRSKSTGDASDNPRHIPVVMPGTSKSSPICLLSDEEEVEDDDQTATRVGQARQITDKRRATLQPQSSSTNEPQIQQPTTPGRARPELPKVPASDPGPRKRGKDAVLGEPIAFQKEKLPCGRVPYPKPGKWSQKHEEKCEKCRQKRVEEIESHEDGTQQPKHGKALPTPPTYVLAENSHGITESGHALANDGEEAKENNQNTTRGKSSQSAKMIHIKLIHEVKKGLSPGDKEGFVYVFQSPQKPGLVKVGFSEHPWAREKQHQRGCGLEMDLPWATDPLKAMKKVEALVKLDLSHVRESWKCSVCPQIHGEWFKIDAEKAKQVVKKWENWINRQDPYKDRNLEPMWRWLIMEGKRPHVDFGQDNHEARWSHWDEVLSPPSPTIINKYNGIQKSQDANQQQEVEGKALAYRQPSLNGGTVGQNYRHPVVVIYQMEN